jgi:hypothetical protein
MDIRLRDQFIDRWHRYFGDTGLPVCYYYTDMPLPDDVAQSVNVHRCLIGNLGRVRDGFSYVYDARTPGCAGGKRFSGMTQTLRPKFEYFLSCGIPGEMEGERYKKSPEIVKESQVRYPGFVAPGKYLVFKRWDKLEEDEDPLAAIFLAGADVLSGLFTLANYDLADANGVITPFGAGCSSIIYSPYLESQSPAPRCVIGMFDVSARPRVAAHELTFTAPFRRFEQMISYLDESFLITASWQEVKARMG